MEKICQVERPGNSSKTEKSERMGGILGKEGSPAKKRWGKLANALITKTKEPEEQNQQLHDKNHGQARQSFRFPAYDVVEIKPDIKPSYAMDRLWLRATAPDFNKTIDIKICVRSQSTKLRDLTGFNNTGNICVWPSEEVLGGYCLENSHLFHEKKILELGGGMTGLAGLMIAQACQPDHVEITDGNENSVENLDILLHENRELGLLKNNVSSRLIKWANGFDELDCIYDVIICADCLFFDEGRPQLLECLKKALKPGGTAIIVAPSRSGTFEEFVSQARDCKSFVVNDMPEHYSERISQVREKLQSDPRYNENLHYPKLVRLEKKH